MGNRFVHSACLMAWLVAITGGGAAESAPGVATPDANGEGRALSGLRPVRLRCEYLANPLGIDVREPRLSWALESEQNGHTQTAYRILAASSEQLLAAGQADLWDSGVVSSAETLHVPYAGTKLASRQRCYWRVQVWDKDGTPAGMSEIAWFEMGLLHTRFDRKLPGKLCACAWTCIQAEVRRLLGRDDVVPGMVAAIQTFGQLLHWHPHFHMLLTCGGFTPEGEFLEAGSARIGPGPPARGLAGSRVCPVPGRGQDRAGSGREHADLAAQRLQRGSVGVPVGR